MKAIVLSYDRMRPVAVHMMLKYAKLWPGHPLRFRMPYQSREGEAIPGCEWVQSPPAIKQTVLTLLRDLDDEAWVYWCIDDKFPVAFDLTRLNQITAWVQTTVPGSISAILFCRCCKLMQARYLTGMKISDPWGNIYLERSGYEQIWMHQFVRVKVIRHLFEQFADTIPYAKIMDEWKDSIRRPQSHRLFVVRDNRAVFGESTRGGVMTKVCYDSFRELGLVLPSWHHAVDPKGLIRGELSGERFGVSGGRSKP